MMGVFVSVGPATFTHSGREIRNGSQRTVGYVITESGCWDWVGCVARSGYGRLRDGRGNTRNAHRVMYERLRGPIPTGLQIDHLCRNRRCVNPDHLEPVTQRVNLLRGKTLVARQAAQTHCKRGHPLTEDNIYRLNGSRRCRSCKRLRRCIRPECPACRVTLLLNTRRSQLKCRGCNYRREAAE